MKQKPTVSVVMITYGHEKYIREAIEGVLMQEGDFELELIVANDCSPDATDAVVHAILKEHSRASCIHYIKHEKNIGMMPNFIFALQQAKGKHIALCDGDDYWTDPYKLQKQVVFLEANPDYVLCFHKIKILKPSGELVDDFITKVPENYETQETLARFGNYIHTPSVVFKNVIQEFPLEFSLSPIGDYFLYMLLTEHGKIKYFEEEMAVYREGIGIWSAKTDYFRNLKTAQTHALIVSAMSKFPVTTKIVNARISNFIEKFKNEISPSDLSLLNTCKAVEEKIFCTLLRDKDPTVYNSTIDSYTLKQLLEIVLIRIGKRIYKIF